MTKTVVLLFLFRFNYEHARLFEQFSFFGFGACCFEQVVPAWRRIAHAKLCRYLAAKASPF